jgi:protein-S-isoprenylcysteine O-methyltransferase Ste14
MADGVEPRPPGAGDKSLGEIVADVTQKLQLLVREEIELAKAEVTTKVKKLGTGAAMASAALVTLLFFSIFLFFGFAHLLNDLFNWEQNEWAGFLIVAAFFLIITIALVVIGLRLIKKGSPPAPEMAIEEAKATRAVLEEAKP